MAKEAEVFPLPHRVVNGAIELSAGVVSGVVALAAIADTPAAPGMYIVGALLGLLAALSIVLAIRTFRCEVLANADGLLVRNYLRTFWVPWSDVDAILLPYQRLNGATVRILQTDGKAIPCRAISPVSRSTPKARDLVRSYQRRLERQLAAARRRGDVTAG